MHIDIIIIIIITTQLPKMCTEGIDRSLKKIQANLGGGFDRGISKIQIRLT